MILALSILRMSWGLITPTVFVSTHDTSAGRVSSLVMMQYRDRIRRTLKERCGLEPPDSPDDKAPDPFRDAMFAIEWLLERFMLVRRVELVDATAPQLWHIIHRGVSHALNQLGHSMKNVLTSTDPLKSSSSVRVVISDLRLMRDTYPDVASDPLFLPSLTFRLKRLGVTTLIVDSDNGRPDQRPSHR